MTRSEPEREDMMSQDNGHNQEEVNVQTAFTDAAAKAAQEAPVEQQPVSEQQPPVEAPQQPEPPQEVEQTPSLLDHAKSLGYDVSQYQSPEELVDGMLRTIQSQNHAIAQMRSVQQQPQAPPPAQEPEEEWDLDKHFAEAWKVPEYNPAWANMVSNGYVTRDQSGTYVPTPGNEWLAMSPELQALNQFESARANVVNDFFYDNNPYQKIWQTIEPAMKRMLDSHYEERFGAQKATDTINAFEQENSSWMYDPSGNPTEHGQKFFDAVSMLQQGGMSDPQKLLEVASRLVPPPSQQPQQQPAQQQPAQGTPVPQQSPPPEQQAAQANLQKQQSFLEESLQAASHQPSSAGGVAPPGQDPGQLSENELKNLFVSRFANHAAA